MDSPKSQRKGVPIVQCIVTITQLGLSTVFHRSVGTLLYDEKSFIHI